MISQCGQAAGGLMVRSGLYEMVPMCWYKKKRFRHSINKNRAKSKKRHSMYTVPQEKHSTQRLLSMYHTQVSWLIYGGCHYTSLRNATRINRVYQHLKAIAYGHRVLLFRAVCSQNSVATLGKSRHSSRIAVLQYKHSKLLVLKFVGSAGFTNILQCSFGFNLFQHSKEINWP